MKTKEAFILITGSVAIFMVSTLIVSLTTSLFIALFGLAIIAFVLWRKSKKEEQEINEIFMEEVEKE